MTVLTPRELDVLKLVAQGLSNPDIARRLVLSEHTVHRHLANILRKLSLSSRAAVAAWGVRTGVVLARLRRAVPAASFSHGPEEATGSIARVRFFRPG